LLIASLLLVSVHSGSPALQIDKVCLSIQLLLQNPNPDDPLDPTIAKQWRENNGQANALAREWTRKYAM
jgi:ubiquitin-protein ligase